jgi:hypothetical protein
MKTFTQLLVKRLQADMDERGGQGPPIPGGDGPARAS